jgi:hypothetical protein
MSILESIFGGENLFGKLFKLNIGRWEEALSGR